MTPATPRRRAASSPVEEDRVSAAFFDYGPLVLIVAATLIAFVPAFQATWIWDDPSYVTGNRTLRTLGGLWDIWAHHSKTPQYYPLVFTTFWLEYHLWGIAPAGYHAVNVLCHAAGACLMYGVLRRLSVPGSALAAVLFAVHPVMVESVAWVTERKNVLSGLLYFASAWCCLRSRFLRVEKDGVTPPAPVDLRFYFAALVLFIGALLSKSVTCSLPAALLLVVYWKRGRLAWRDVLPLLPFFVVALPLALHTAWLEKHQVGATGPRWVYGETKPEDLAARCLIAGRCVWFYAWKIVWPTKLAFIYPRFDIDARQPWQYVFPAAALGAAAALFFLRDRIGRGPLAAVLFFGGTLFPALGFFAVYPHRFSFVADHFQYLAAAGLLTFIAVIVTRLTARSRVLQFGVAAVVVVPLMALTFQQAKVYANAEVLWRDTLTKTPDSWMVYTNLGNALVDQKRYDEAGPYFVRALELDPTLHDTHQNYGIVLIRQHRIDEAEREFREAIRLDPNFAPAIESLARLYLFEKNDPVTAEGLYRHALDISPTYGDAHYGMGVLCERQGKTDEAIEHYRRALDDRPILAEAHYNLANLMLARKQYPEAIAGFTAALDIEPAYAEAWTNLGAAQLLSGRPNDAIAAFQRALRLNSNLVPAQRGIQAALRMLQGVR